ncbi:MAG: hypothetical protein CO136_00910 [Candidatus Levybacteria bacterium CG_4_9_14_3_um_filter_36_7]|nr:MAG: hypothetical protein CO136_00910 [Candidatus Levybacteria bacterium CG_4_9_14_3_um_filter_36_7]
MKYLLKKINATSTEAKGKGICNKKDCEFLVAAPVKSFTSKDSNRDTNMLTYTKASDFPMVVVKLKTLSEFKENGNYDLDISFAGQSHTYKNIAMKSEGNDTKFKVKGTIPLLLSDFNVERPELLLVKVDDLTPIEVEVTFSRH